MGHTGKHNFDHFDSNMRRTPEHREGTMDDVPIAISKVDGSPVVEVSTALNGVRNEEEGFLDDNSLLGRRWMCTVVVAGVIMVIAGTVDVQLITLMNRQQLPPCENCEIRYFEAPFFQTWLVHVAGLFVLPIYFIARHYGTLDIFASSSFLPKSPCPKYLWLIPTVLEITSTVASNYSLLFVDPATARMLMALNILLTVGLRLFFLRKHPTMYESLGVMIVTLGMILAALHAILNSTVENNYKGLQWLGVVMTLVATVISAVQYVIEERFFSMYECSFLEAVAFMGLYGTMLGLVLLTLGQLTGFEDVRAILYQMSLGVPESKTIIICCFSYLISVSFFNVSSTVAVKFGSSVLRGVINASRTVSLWAVQLALGQTLFSLVVCAAMFMIIVGNGIYHYNFYVKKDCWKGDEWMRKPITGRPKERTAETNEK